MTSSLYRVTGRGPVILELIYGALRHYSLMTGVTGRFWGRKG
ncbi:MAG: hypothetical protein AVDCRST_MAG93-7971 [uncultured Chloroflexia bacterium]|uniref:Uncharacterized protein n=1 Tax=uncultured Chloroflexia bacterium TaxID=1672391 RepID=A0A6J4MQ93_9CHLR|nr:MAG: hypothetical protein AVDCRST_MAG93-7971 [uncultured Chloroflexia bacterium]